MADIRGHRETDVQRAARTLPAPPDPVDYKPGEPSAKRILLVDDDPDIARFVQVNLRSAVAVVDIAADAEEALERLDADPYDLVITGVMMPRMDGFELVRRLRHRPDTKDLPILILTARSLPTDIWHGFAAGADDYMVKPFDPIELLAHVRALLRRGHPSPRRLTDG